VDCIWNNKWFFEEKKNIMRALFSSHVPCMCAVHPIKKNTKTSSPMYIWGPIWCLIMGHGLIFSLYWSEVTALERPNITVPLHLIFWCQFSRFIVVVLIYILLWCLSQSTLSFSQYQPFSFYRFQVDLNVSNSKVIYLFNVVIVKKKDNYTNELCLIVNV
jgi:hypothetical protein